MVPSKEILSHTADLKIRLAAETLPELFLLALQSLNQLLEQNFENYKHTASMMKRIELQSPDTTSLLIDFLSEVLTLSQIHKVIFFDFHVDEMTDCKISGRLSGSYVETFDEDVKAVTYHEAEVKMNTRGEWETVIIFDI